MTARELDAAGIIDPRLRAAYARCRRLNARHGRTFFLATRLLPPSRRPAIHALYGFARHADDIVDEPDPGLSPAQIAARLDRLAAALLHGLTQRNRVGELLGQIRDAEHELPADTIQRITTENTNLKQRVRQLTTDNRTLDERLKAARSNLRFQDRRLADLEAQLAGPAPNR